jgi:D-serine deaminase-like pyridoxal phosphate-dependent protein
VSRRHDQTLSRRGISRRGLAVGAGALALGAGVFAMTRPADQGGPHDAYFAGLSNALKAAGIYHPVMVIDQARLDANIAAIAGRLAKPGGRSQPLPLRVVVKSLPSLDLLRRVSAGASTNRFMVFSRAMLETMVTALPDADVLMGKPLPTAEVAALRRRMGTSEAPAARPQWLVDTLPRLEQLIAVAKADRRPLRVSFEIDVGLHRGGFVDSVGLAAAIDRALAEPLIEISGLMGYDPHVPKVPNPKEAYNRSQALYADAISVLTSKTGKPKEAFTLNAAGSPTFMLHNAGTVANEVSVGSAFVKPTDFDLDTLDMVAPAAFIATPVLKSLDRTRLPGVEALSGIFKFLDRNTAKAVFIHGGHWLAKPVSPPGLQYSSLFGRSSNQELLTGSESVVLAPDDTVFLRPTQSEAILLQFADLVVFDGKSITGVWPTFPISA